MAIIDIDTDDPIIPKETTPKLYRTNSELATSTLFAKDRELNDIARYIGGKKWSVSYFKQVRGINDEPSMPDINVPATTLKYDRVDRLILFVDTAIDQTNPNEITGSAVINAGFVPNYGDPFIATLTGGRESVFVITSVQKQTYNIHEVYTVEFKLHVFLDKTSAFYNDLLYKTLKVFVYDPDYIKDYSTPILLDKDYVKKVDIKRAISPMVEFYLETVISSENSYIALPTTSSVYVDTMLESFFFSIVNTDMAIKLQSVTRLNNELSKVRLSIWDVIMKKDIGLLKIVEKDIGFKYTPYSNSRPVTRDVGWSNVSFIADKLDDGITAVTPPLATNPFYNDTHVAPLGAGDSYYALSDAFYIQDIASMGSLEKLLTQYLKDEVIDTDALNVLIDEYMTWDTIDQFYGIPILLFLTIVSVQHNYSAI